MVRGHGNQGVNRVIRVSGDLVWLRGKECTYLRKIIDMRVNSR